MRNLYHGAAALLVNDSLATCYLRLYSECEPTVPTAEALPADSGPNAEFAQHIQTLLKRDEAAWDALATTFAEVRKQRAENLAGVIAVAHAEADKAHKAD